MTQGESRLSRSIMAALRTRGVWCMKIHGGPTMMAGAPDIIACVPVTISTEFQGIEIVTDPVGIFVGFETKTPEGGMPTPIQAHVHDKIRAAYGQVYVPRSVQDAVETLYALGWIDPRANR